MAERYFLDKLGARTNRVGNAPGKGHIVIAKMILSEMGVVPENDADAYARMFANKYARVVEFGGDLVEIEHRHKLTAGQKQYLSALEAAGKTLVYTHVTR